MTDHLFLDANVLFTAAHNSRGKAAFLFDRQHLQQWRLCTSAYACEEARRNLVRKYPRSAERLESLLADLAMADQPAIGALPIPLPEKDQPILAAALHAGCSHLLTGDRQHFGVYMNRADPSGGLIIQTVADYLGSL